MNIKLIVTVFFTLFILNCHGMHRFTQLAQKARFIGAANMRGTLSKPFVSKRPVVGIANLKGTYNALNGKKHLSPVHGAIFYESGVIKKMYNWYSDNGNNYATISLIRSLFYENGAQFRPTQNKSNPGYSLNPKIIADIFYLLENNTLDKPEVRENIIEQWRDEHRKLTDNKLSKNKVSELIDLIISSAQECKKNIFLPCTTQKILLSFLYIKGENKEYLQNYLGHLFKDEKIVFSDSSYSREDLGCDYISQLSKKLENKNEKDTVNQEFEHLACALMINAKPNLSEQIIQKSYGFQGQKPRPNCVESAFHDFLNLLFYNPHTGLFDLTMVSNVLKINDKLNNFYALQNFEAKHINTPAVGQAFMDLVSGHNFLTYNRKNYELMPSLKNFINLLNYLFNINAKSLEELSESLSGDNQKIIIHADSKVDNNTNINISIQSKKYNKNYNVNLSLSPNHGQLSVKERKGITNQYGDNIANNVWTKTVNEACLNSTSLSTMLPNFLFRTTDIKNLSMLHHLYSLVDIEDPNTILWIIKDACYQIKKFPELIKLMQALLNKLPNDDYFISDVIKTFIESGAYNYDESFKKYCSGRSKKIYKNVLVNFVSKENPNFENISIIINLGGDINDALMHFIDYNNINACKICLDLKANPNISYKFGNRVVERAVTRGSIEIAEMLIAYGADINIKDETDCWAILHHAAFCNKIDVAKFFLEKGADPNIKNEFGRTPLSMAAQEGHAEIAELLIAHGADVNIKDEYDQTILHDVITSDKVDINIIKLLLEKGADPNVKDKLFKKTPLQKAIGMNRTEIADLLAAHIQKNQNAIKV